MSQQAINLVLEVINAFDEMTYQSSYETKLADKLKKAYALLTTINE